MNNELRGLPKYWVVKNDDSQRFKDTVIAFINKNANHCFSGNIYSYYYDYAGAMTKMLANINVDNIAKKCKTNNYSNNIKFTIGGTLNLRKAFVADSNIPIYHEESYNYPNLTMSDRTKDANGMMYMFTGKTDKHDTHFELPRDWDAAMEYVKSITKTKFNVGDWITVERLPNEKPHWLYDTKQRTFKIMGLPTNFNNKGMMWSTSGASNEYINSTRGGYCGIPEYCFRHATKDEIEAAKKIGIVELKFGDVTFRIKYGDDFATTSHGKVTREEINNAIQWLKNPPRLAGNGFTIHTKSGFNSITKCDAPASHFEIGFGCKKGKLSELEAILNAFSNGKKE